ncbi:hypothetical protein [Wenyingzhuangia sp. IMCC45574]
MKGQEFLLKILRKLFSVYADSYVTQKLDDIDKVSMLIYNELMSDKPTMIARLGAFELGVMVNYKGVKNKNKSVLNYVKGKEPDWWWNHELINFLHVNAGFFPPSIKKIEEFCEMMFEDLKETDILGSWQSNEMFIEDEVSDKLKVSRGKIDPFWAKKPWTHALKQKKVLVVHPFEDTINSQYKKKDLLFENALLPEFELKTIKAVQTLAGETIDYKDWFEALESMKTEIDKTDFDICLIGAGAYGFPLAAHVKRIGKKAVHMGGSLQLLFGIKGSRWENEKIVGKVNYQQLFNEYWCKPLKKETPRDNKKVEGGAYW